MRKGAITLAFAISAAGCAAVGPDEPSPRAGPEGSPSPTPSPTHGADVTLTLIAASEGPVARLTGRGGEVEAAPFTACWTMPDGSLCSDGFPTAPEAFLEVPQGSTIGVAGDADTVTAGVARFRRGEVGVLIQEVRDLPLEDGTAIIDVDPGDYVLQVFATFEQGDGSFALGLRVLPPGEGQ